MSWGMRGTYFAVFIRLMPGLVWDGIEAWWGGQAVSTMIGTMSLRWANWTHPLAQGTMELKDFVGFVIYYVVCKFFLLTRGREEEEKKGEREGPLCRPPPPFFFAGCFGKLIHISPTKHRPNSHVAPPRKNASTLHGILRRLHADRFRTFDLVRPPLQQHGRALLRSRLPTGRTFSKLAALGGDLWSDFGVGKRRSGDVVAGGLVSICEEWESDSDDCADCCLSFDDLCGL